MLQLVTRESLPVATTRVVADYSTPEFYRLAVPRRLRHQPLSLEPVEQQPRRLSADPEPAHRPADEKLRKTERRQRPGARNGRLLHERKAGAFSAAKDDEWRRALIAEPRAEQLLRPLPRHGQRRKDPGPAGAEVVQVFAIGTDTQEVEEEEEEIDYLLEKIESKFELKKRIQSDNSWTKFYHILKHLK